MPITAQEKVDTFITSMIKNPRKLDLLEKALEKSGFCLMTRLTKDTPLNVENKEERLKKAKKGIVLDTETTGIDTDVDEIIQLAMVEFFYDDDGIISIGDIYDEFNEPKKEITQEIQALTNISPHMVKGRSIDLDIVKNMVESTDLIIAHNAGFDRRILENNLPDCGFDKKSWGCSLRDIDWKKRGKRGQSLEVLAVEKDLKFGAHRADVDCLATIHVLNDEDKEGRTAFSELLENSRRETVMVIAWKADIKRKDDLKERGYNWCAQGKETFGFKAWYRQIQNDDEIMNEEADFIRGIFGADVSLPAWHMDGTIRYSDRKPENKEWFRTAEIRTLAEYAAQQQQLADTVMPN